MPFNSGTLGGGFNQAKFGSVINAGHTAGIDEPTEALVLSATTGNKSETTAITIDATLSAVSAVDIDVTVTFSGGHSQEEDYGVGKHYTLTSAGAVFANPSYNVTTADITIPAGSLYTRITMTLVDNQVRERDRVITVSTPAISKEITIVDDNVDYIIDVTDPGDATEDLAAYALESGRVDNSDNLNAILDYLRDNSKTAVLYFPTGEYQFTEAISPYGVSFVGAGRDVTVLKRLDGYDTRGYPYWEYVFKSDSYESAVDSAPIVFVDLEVDGNSYGGIKINLAPGAVDDFERNETLTLNFYETGEEHVITFTDDDTGGLNVKINHANRAAMAADLATVIEANWEGASATVFDTSQVHVTYGDGLGETTAAYLTASLANCTSDEITRTSLEHSYCLWCVPAEITSAGKTVFKFENVEVGKNPCSGGITVPGQSDVSVYNYISTGVMPYGMYGYWGSHSKHRLKNVTSVTTKSYIHKEHLYEGYGADPAVDIWMEDVSVAEMLIGIAGTEGSSPDSTCIMNRVTAFENFHWTGSPTALPSSVENIVFTECDLTRDDLAEFSFLINPGIMTFNNCHFRHRNSTGLNYAYALRIDFEDLVAQRVYLNNCTFLCETGSDATNRCGIVNNEAGSDFVDYDQQILLDTCTFEGDFTKCFGTGELGTGGYYYAKDCVYSGDYAFKLPGSSDTSNWYVEIDGGTFNNDRFAYIYNCNTDGNVLKLDNIVMTAARSVTTWFTYTGQIERLTVSKISGDGVMRRLTNGAAAPTSSNRAFLGDSGADYDSWEYGAAKYKPTDVDPMTWASY